MITLSDAFNRIENEIWKDIPNYEGIYQASNFGRIKSLKRYGVSKNRILKSGKNTDGYLQVCLNKNGVSNYFRVHRLIAMSFFDLINEEKQKTVNHINFDKTNNSISNLEILSVRDNVIHFYKNHKTNCNYTGVYFDKRTKNYSIRIKIKNKLLFLGKTTCEIYGSEIYKLACKNINLYNGDVNIFKIWLHNNFIKNN